MIGRLAKNDEGDPQALQRLAQTMAAPVPLIEIPRLDASEDARDQFIVQLRQFIGARLVLTTPFWPPGRLEHGWFDWLHEAATAVPKTVDQLTFAELTTELYDDLLRTQSEALARVGVELIDQVFRTSGRIAGQDARQLHEALNERGRHLIPAKLVELGLIREAHIELRNGWHIDREVKFGSFFTVRGGEGFCRYLAAMLARKLGVRPSVATLIYWADAVRHYTLPRLMKEVAEQMACMGRHVEPVKMVGAPEEPTLPSWFHPNELRGIALSTDIVASGNLIRAVHDALIRYEVRPEVVAPLLQFEFAPGFAVPNYVKTIRPPIVEAHHWTSKEQCRLSGEPKRPDAESRLPSEQFDVDDYQMSKGSFWSMMTLGGRVGGRPGEDPRHLHETFLEPSLDPDHLDALLAGVLPEIVGEPLALVYHDNDTCRAIQRRIKARTAIRDVYAATKIGGDWRIGQIGPLADDGVPVVVIDDGGTTALSILHLLYKLRDARVPVAAVILVEDKLDPAMRFALTRLCEQGAWLRQTRLFSLHRSPHVGPGFIEGVCDVCDREVVLGAICAARKHRPSFAIAATDELLAHDVWPGKAGAERRSGRLVEVEISYPASTQLNRLLAGHPELMGSRRMLDVIVRDNLPIMRTGEGLVGAILGLDPPWQERALLCLAGHEVNPLADQADVSPALQISDAIRAVRAAGTRDAFASGLRRVAVLFGDHPDLGERRYGDVIAAICGLLAHRGNRAAWIAAGVEATCEAKDSALQAINADLRHLGRYLPFMPSASAPTLEFHAPDHGVFERDNIDLDRLLRDFPWVLDMRRPPFVLRRGRDSWELDEFIAVCWMMTVFKRRLFTAQATAFFAKTLSRDRATSQDSFERARRHAKRTSPVAIVKSNQAPRLQRVEHCLDAVDEPGVVLWRADNQPLWQELTALAPKLVSGASTQ